MYTYDFIIDNTNRSNIEYFVKNLDQELLITD